MRTNNMDIVTLFPTPVGVFELPELSVDQMSWIMSQDVRPNSSNRTSQNTCLLDDEALVCLRDNIKSCVSEYTTGINKTPDNVSLRITQSWCNYNGKGEWHHKHCHQNSVLSGVYYVHTDEEDKIYFYNEKLTNETIQVKPTEFNEYNSRSWWLPATQGTLILFPSELPHSVSERTHNGPDRVSLSFNTFYTGTIGTEENLTLLHL